MVFPLFEFLNVLSDKQVVQKTLDKEYKWWVSILYEFLNVLSELKILKKTLYNKFNSKVFLLCNLSCVAANLLDI
jgi:hypothetical protein